MSAGRNRWAIVLAGGDGREMEPFVRGRLGYSRPKQFCSFTGGRTMLEHTFDRALAVAPAERVLTVVAADQRRFLSEPRPLAVPGPLVVEPRSRGTAAGTLLPLTGVLAVDPAAVVVVMPSDHFIQPLERFASAADEACRLAEDLPWGLVLLAAEPDRPEPACRWLQLGGHSSDEGARTVLRFHDRPGPEEAAELRRLGAQWNTTIIAARAALLWSIAVELRPRTLERFAAIMPLMGRPGTKEAIERAYRDMPEEDFERDILEPSAEWTAVLTMRGVRWRDWGQPGRVVETLCDLGRRPSFSAASLEGRGAPGKARRG